LAEPLEGKGMTRKKKVTATISSGEDITERERMEEALREAEDRYRAIFENAKVGMAILEEDTISLINPELERAIGYQRKDIEGKSWTKFVHPDDVKRMIEYHEKRRESPEAGPEEYEFRWVDKNGNTRYAILGISMIRGGKSLISMLDITERKQMEEAIRESEEKYRDLAENAADMQLLMDLRGNLTYMSKSAEDETGYTREEIVGRSIRELLTQESYKIAVERIKKRVEGIKELPIYEVEVKAKDGRIIPFELNTSPVIKDGKLTAIHIVARNITERKRAEEETKYQRTYFQSLFNDSPEAIVSLDERFRVININPAFHEIFGY
jgi:PAS domain S-box-containing protein